jgi:hypothetical protein
VSEQDSTIRPDDEDVEAHRKSRTKAAADEPTDAESESDDDVELHGLRSKRDKA